MHWFWRAVIAVVVGFVVERVFVAVPLVGFVPPPGATPTQRFMLAIRVSGPFGLIATLLAMTVPLVVYCYLTRRHERRVAESETRCRKCYYILRGLTEPRCPECGERI